MEDDLVQDPAAPNTPPVVDPTIEPTTTPQEPPAPPTPAPTQEPQAGDPIAKARQEEKNKLYPRITELENQVKDLQTQLAEKDAEIARLTSALTEAETTMGELNNQIQSQSLTAEQIRTEMQAVLDEREAKHAEELRKEKLNNYRAQKIAAANGQLIPELVTGDDEAAIDASIEASKARYAEIASAATAAAGAQTPPPPPPTVNPPQMPPSSAQGTPVADARNLSNADWAAKRKEAFAAAAATFQPAAQ